MRKALSMLLCLVMAAALCAGCAGTPAPVAEPTATPAPAPTEAPTPEPQAGYTPGAYEGTAMGFNGQVPVTVTLSEDAITAVEVGENSETANVGSLALSQLPGMIVENQSLADTVSGATFSSNALISAVEKALESAGVAPEAIAALKANAVTEPLPEDTTTDILVVGAGASGMMAAIIAKDSGANVILLEKMGITGGSTRLDGGAVWAINCPQNAVSSAYLTDAGADFTMDYTAEDILEHFKEYAGPVNNEGLFLKLANGTTDSVGYLLNDGFKFMDSYVTYSNQVQRPTWRSLLAQGSGAGLAEQLTGFVAARDIDLRLNNRATALIQDGEGNVTGATVETAAGSYTITAKKVILATGGFSHNPEMIEEYCPGTFDDTNLICASVSETGDGHQMGLAVGGQMIGSGIMGITGIGRKVGTEVTLWNPPFMVNINGEKAMRSDEYYPMEQKIITAQPEGKVFAIYGSDTASVDALESVVARGLAVKADTLEALAQELGINAEGLAAAVEENNACVDAGTADALGGDPAFLKPIKEGPYYGMRRDATVMGTIPGLIVDEDLKVLDAEGQPIGNLYAIGELMFGNLFSDIYPMTGTANTLCMSAGRFAALDAVETME